MFDKEKEGTFKLGSIIAVPDKLGTEADELFHKRLKKSSCRKINIRRRKTRHQEAKREGSSK
jgi:hypothetical protein